MQFFLLAVKASTRPEVLDDENEMLRKRLNRLLYGLLLQGIPGHVDGFVLSGARVSEETMIRQFSELRDFYHSNPPHRVKLNESTCRTAKTFKEGYRAIEKSTAYERVKRGMSALARAISEPTSRSAFINMLGRWKLLLSRKSAGPPLNSRIDARPLHSPVRTQNKSSKSATRFEAR